MEEEVVEASGTLCSILPRETEFWSAILGAIVGAIAGGFIAYAIQVKALREGRKQRAEDHKQAQQALANALLIKMARIYSNFHGIRQHFENSFERAAQDGFKGEPWEIVIPLANLPDPVHFSSEEMGMLLALKNGDVFNLVISMDVIHNSLIDALKVLHSERTALTERLPADDAEGTVISTGLNKQQTRLLLPRMITVNNLIRDIRVKANEHVEESDKALGGLQKVLRDKLGLDYELGPLWNRRSWRQQSVREKVLVNLLQIQRLVRTTTNIIPDHQPRRPDRHGVFRALLQLHLGRRGDLPGRGELSAGAGISGC